MQTRVESYRDAARRGAQWLLSQQNSDGSFLGPDLQADVYHKAPYALGLTGYALEANRLLNWIKAHDLAADGRLHHFDAGLALYKTNWICQGAHRLARFDISAPVMRYILQCQAPCGGFFQVVEGNEYVEPVCTSWAGVSTIYAGRLEIAIQAARCLASMIDQQPDETRFYCWLTPEGQLVTEDAPLPAGVSFLDARSPQQAYYNPGIACLFLTRLYLATNSAEFLNSAQRLFELSLGWAEDAYAYPTAGKSAVAAANLYLITGDERARDAACSMGDYLVQEQSEEGWWRNPHSDGMIVRLDHTAEFVAFMSEIAATLGSTL